MLNSIKIIGLIIENPRKKKLELKNLEHKKKLRRWYPQCTPELFWADPINFRCWGKAPETPLKPIQHPHLLRRCRRLRWAPGWGKPREVPKIVGKATWKSREMYGKSLEKYGKVWKNNTGTHQNMEKHGKIWKLLSYPI